MAAILLEAALESVPQMTVPTAEVFTIIQYTVCLIGNTSKLTSQYRRAQILEVIESSWSKFSVDVKAGSDTLFGDDFQEFLTRRTEKEMAPSKAVSIPPWKS